MTTKEGTYVQRLKHLSLFISKVEAFLGLNGLLVMSEKGIWL